jgi:hypothetical protein
MTHEHCDDYIDDMTQPECLRVFLEYARSPAHGSKTGKPKPSLFADYEGKRVRVVMASRLGDVGITDYLVASYGYNARVEVASLSNFGDKS